MASIRIAGFGGPGDPYVENYNAADQAELQEIVDEVNANLEKDENGDPINPYILGTYLYARITEMVQSWRTIKTDVKAREVAQAYREASDADKLSVVAILGL